MRNRQASLVFIFITILVDVIGIGIILPVIPTLIQNLTGEGLGDAARWGGWLMASYAIVQFVFAPILGELSDKYGRRPVLLVSLFGLGLDYIFHALAPTIGWLFVGRILAGITGASHTVATAYIADISTKKNKASNFGMVGAAWGLGFIIGPVVGGYFSQWGVQVPFFVAAGVTLLNFAYGLVLVPESLPQEKRRAVRYAKMIPGVSLAHLRAYVGLGALIAAIFMANIAGHVIASIWSFFTMELFAWDESQVGYSLASIGLLVAMVQLGLVGWSVRRFGSKNVIMAGFILNAVGMMLFCLASEGWMVYVFLVPYILGGIAGPTLQSVTSNSVPDTQQGNLQGALTSLVNVTLIISLLLYPNVFYIFTSSDYPYYFPAAPFVIAAAFLVVACVILFFALKKLDFSYEKAQ
ncbi:MAG: TCR/Tet family MFS transporter [Pirellulales bacterium]|nr:TCR/Tet family MFS transporter [Pirellulales bacterium]